VSELRETSASTAARSEILDLGWFHRYPARFALDALRDMFRTALDQLGRDPRLVLDPFAGTGATMAASRQLGYPSIGIELSALGCEISRLRLDPPASPGSVAATVIGWTHAEPETSAGLDPTLESWLGNSNAAALSTYRRRCAELEDPRDRRFATVVLSQSLRPSSRWLSGSVKLTADPKRVPPPLPSYVRKHARAVLGDCLLETRRLEVAAGIAMGDATALPLPDGRADLVLTSPPYFITYDYFEVNRLSYMAFGWPQPVGAQIGAKRRIARDGVGFAAPAALSEWYADRLGGEDHRLGRALRTYLQRMGTALSEMARVLRPGGVLAMAVADSTRQAVNFPLTDGLRELVEAAGFVDVVVADRHRGDTRILPFYRHATTGRFAPTGVLGTRERVLYATRGPR
jgi:DNA methylase